MAAQDEGVSIGSIAFYLLIGVPGVALTTACVLVASPFFGALTVIAALLAPILDDDVRTYLARRIHIGGHARASPDGGVVDPPVANASHADTWASVILCLRDSGYEAEAASCEQTFVTAGDLDELGVATSDFGIGTGEFEKLFYRWLKAGGSQTAEHDQLRQSLVERRRANVGDLTGHSRG
jgi:hypothetical protein